MELVDLNERTQEEWHKARERKRINLCLGGRCGLGVGPNRKCNDFVSLGNAESHTRT